MRTSLTPAELGFTSADRERLARAVAQAKQARCLRRCQAVLFVAEGHSFAEAAHLSGLSARSVYRSVTGYLRSHSADALREGRHTGRPPDAPELSARRILRELRRAPLKPGYRTNVWTVELLAFHLSQKYACPITPWTLRRRMKRMGLRCKRPRYFYSEKERQPGAEKGAIVRKLKRMPAGAVLLMEDETILRLFPVLRRAWSLSGEQARVPITGRNAKRVLFGTINLRTGHRLVWRGPNMRQEQFQFFLREVRRRYAGRPVWMLLDEAPCHVAARSKALAATLGVELIWSPKQCSERNAMDHLWREMKGTVSANYQFASIDEHTGYAESWVLKLSTREALRKAGVLSKNFWLRLFLP